MSYEICQMSNSIQSEIINYLRKLAMQNVQQHLKQYRKQKIFNTNFENVNIKDAILFNILISQTLCVLFSSFNTDP